MFGLDYQLPTDCNLSGLKIAEVINNVDNTAQERVWVRVIGVHDMDIKEPEYCIVAHHLAPSKSNSGEIPDVGDYIWVMFPDVNNPMYCLWLGWVRHGS